MEHTIIEIAPPGPPEDPRRDWPQHLRDEFAANEFGPGIGNRLVFENERCRVWHLHLPAGGFLTFHRHVLDYFWSALTGGTARGYYEDGRIQDVIHYPGETRFFFHGEGEHFVHAIENVGETELIFVTVEFLPGANQPTVIPDSYRMAPSSDV